MKLFIEKDLYKFSSAHMTVFPNGKKENLHGHNYYVGVRIYLKSTQFKDLIDFSEFKEILKTTCDEWDEKILLAIKNPFYQEKICEHEIEITLCKKRYVFPLDEVVRLPIENISSENLSEELLRILVHKLNMTNSNFVSDKKILAYVTSIELIIEETRGQGAVAEWKN